MIHSVHSCFHTIYLAFFFLSKFDHSSPFSLRISLLILLELVKQISFFFFRKINQTQPKDRLVGSTNIQVFYLRQQNKGTKNFSFFFTDFFFLYYGGDLISNNLNDNILKKKIMLFYFFGLFFDFFFWVYFSNLFFFQPDLFLYFTFIFFFCFIFFF